MKIFKKMSNSVKKFCKKYDVRMPKFKELPITKAKAIDRLKPKNKVDK